MWRIEWSRIQWRHVTLEGKGRDPEMFGAQYPENGWKRRLGYKLIMEHLGL